MGKSFFTFMLAVFLGMSFGGSGLMASVPFAFAGSDESRNSKDGSETDGKESAKKDEKAADSKVTICHVTAGNPSNRHTLSVDQSAVDAHMSHGDTMGACAAEATTTGGHAPSNVREILGR